MNNTALDPQNILLQDLSGVVNCITSPCLPYNTTTRGPITTTSKPMLEKDVLIENEFGQPLTNANVKLVGTTYGATPGPDGIAFIPGISPDSLLRITHVGYKTIERRFKDLDSSITMQLKEEELDEVVITVNNKDTDTKKIPWTLILGSVAGIFLISALASGGQTGKTGLAGSAKKNSKKKSSKKKGAKKNVIKI